MKVTYTTLHPQAMHAIRAARFGSVLPQSPRTAAPDGIGATVAGGYL